VVCCKAYFDILNRLGVTHKCVRRTDGQTDGRTNILVASAALKFVAQPYKTTAKK